MKDGMRTGLCIAVAVILVHSAAHAQQIRGTERFSPVSPSGFAIHQVWGTVYYSQVGTEAAGIYRLDPAGPVRLAAVESFARFITLPAFAVTPDGTVWFGHASLGINRLAGSTAVPVISETPFMLEAATDHAVWYTRADVAEAVRLTAAGSVDRFPLPGPGFSMAPGTSGSMWLSGPGRTLRLSATGTVLADVPQRLVDPMADGTGGLWGRTQLGTLLHLNAAGATVEEIDIPADAIHASVAADGTIYVSTGARLVMIRNGSSSMLTLPALVPMQNQCENGYQYYGYPDAGGVYWLAQIAFASTGGPPCVPAPPQASGILRITEDDFAVPGMPALSAWAMVTLLAGFALIAAFRLR